MPATEESGYERESSLSMWTTSKGNVLQCLKLLTEYDKHVISISTDSLNDLYIT